MESGDVRVVMVMESGGDGDVRVVLVMESDGDGEW